VALENVAGDLSVKISILILVVRKKMCDCHAPQQRHSKEHHIDLPRSHFPWGQFAKSLD
jgi:hypothetical protein